MQKTTIQERQQQAGAQCDQLSAHAEQTAELFHMSTQVFLNTPKLIDHLTQLKSGETMDALTLLNFFREDIASLEKIVLSNPNLYQIRVYSVAEDCSEMVPILYSARRLAQAPWYSEDFQSGTWYFDYADTLLRERSPVEHVMSFVTEINTVEAGTIGVLEVSAQMGKLLRYSMKWESGNVRLSRELDYIENYIALMNLRFDYVIRLDMEIPEELKQQRLPKISLQPVVENAVVHGAAVLAADTTIVIRGEVDREKGRYAIHIHDEGKGMDEAALNRLRCQIDGEEAAPSSAGNGIGLHNVQSRIQRCFGPDFGLSVTSRVGEGTTVTFILPFQGRDEEET